MFLLSLLAQSALTVGAAPDETVKVFVELSAPPAGAVVEYQAQQNAQPFFRFHHGAEVASAQDQLLADVAAAGIEARVTESTLHLAAGPEQRPNRFHYLINGLELELRASDLERVRHHPAVKRVTLDETFELLQDNSVEYVRASDGPGEKTIFSRDGGALMRFDGTGQVIAIFDTGIEHTHPCFDTRFDDLQFGMRTGDTRPVRLAGEAYQEGTHHPKVVYFLPLTAVTNEDDVGHGTHAAGDSAGVMVQGPGLDRIPGNADDQVIEGVAPGALLMNYKLCETTFTCVGTTNIVTALEDALSPTDPAGNPKPVATVINMSFGGGSGDPNAPSAVACDNAALLGVVMVSSAGNSGPGEQTVGAPSAARRVICVGATNDPGEAANEVDVLGVDPLRYGVAGASTGAQDDTGLPTAAEDIPITAFPMAGAPQVEFGLGQHFVYCGLADTSDQVPDEVNGCIALIARGSTLDLGATGTGTFASKVANASAKGAVAVLIYNNVDGELEGTTAAASTIPVFGLSRVNGEYLRDTIGFQSPLFDTNVPATWGTISNQPVRINPPDPGTYSPATTGFSSKGSIVQARYVKPDVTAPGLNVYGPTIAAGGASTGGGTMSDPSRFIAVSGTSFSGPHVAGAAALVRGAVLDMYGEAPLPAADLRSGAAAADQLAQLAVAPQSLVRAALTNTATNLREADGETPVADSDPRTFVHEIGGGLIHVIESVDVRAALGTNDLNGFGGPDLASDPDFLPTHSFGNREVIGTGVVSQVSTITVTLENVSGPSAAGTYALALVDGGDTRGDVTASISTTTGFALDLSNSSVALGGAVGDSATFDVTVDVNGSTDASGLAAAGLDVAGIPATEFLWYVTAVGTNGETLRMPFSYRAAQPGPQAPYAAPFLEALADDSPADQTDGVDRDGRFVLSWTFPAGASPQPCGYVIEQATTLDEIFADDAEEALVQGGNTNWSSDPAWVSIAHPSTATLGYNAVYTDEQDSSLEQVTPMSLPAGTRPILSFASYEDIEADYDYGYVEVSRDGAPFFAVAVYTGFFDGRRSVDLSDYAGSDVRVRFRFVSDELISAPVHQGWFIDDISVEVTDFVEIGSVDHTTTSIELSVPVRGPVRTVNPGVTAQVFYPARTFLYRVSGRFGEGCGEDGPYSNLRDIVVDATSQSMDAK